LEKHRSGIVVKQVAAGREFSGCPFYSKPDVIHFKVPCLCNILWMVYRNLPVDPSLCPYFLYAQLFLNGWTNTDETLHSCSIRPEEVKKKNPGLKRIKGDNSRGTIIRAVLGVSFVILLSKF